MIRTLVIAVGVAFYALANFPPLDRQFERCRADWLAAFKPAFAGVITELSADYQFLRACMASKGFDPKPDPCTAGAAMTWSNCYVRRVPWQ